MRMNSVKKLAVYITGHGYGHLTRTLEICKSIQKMDASIEIHLRAPFDPDLIKNSFGFAAKTHDCVRLDIGLVQRDSLNPDMEATVEQLGYWYGPEGDALVEIEAEWLSANAINAALIDLSPRAFEACAKAGVPAYGMSNFSWDFIWQDLAEQNQPLARFAELASTAYSTSKKLYRTVMHHGMTSFPVIEDVPLVARHSMRASNEIRSKLKIVSKKPIVALSYGGEGLQVSLDKIRHLHEKYLFVTTDPMADHGAPFIHITNSHLVENGLIYADLVKASDLLMTKPGYSTVAEAKANGAAIIYSDRGRFAEYEYIVHYIKTHLRNAFLPKIDLLNGEWTEALESALAKSDSSLIEDRTDGAEVVAALLLKDAFGIV